MSKDVAAKNSSSLRRFWNKILQILAKKEMFPGNMRARLHKMRGVQFDEVSSAFFGDNVTIDSISPHKVRIGKRCVITAGVKILTHFIDTSRLSDDPGYYFHFYEGEVTIEDDVFLGYNVIIAKPVMIGKGSLIGANSVVTTDIPPNSIASGNPAKVVREFDPSKRAQIEEEMKRENQGLKK